MKKLTGSRVSKTPTRRKFALLTATMFLAPGIVSADETKSKILFYGGAEAGYFFLNAKDAGEFRKQGYSLGLKGIGSYQASKWTLDAGAGWMFNQIQTISTTASKRFRISTGAGTAEFSPKFRSRQFSVGPIAALFYGKDVSFSESTLAEQGQKTVTFLGVQSYYQPQPAIGNSKRTDLRIGLTGLTDVNLQKRQAWSIAFGVQFGFSPFSNRSNEDQFVESLPAEPSPAPEATPILQPTPDPSPSASLESVSELSAGPQILVTLEGEVFYFDTNSTKLRPEARRYLKGLARILNKDQNRWRKIEVEGHADRRGPDHLNISLSFDRANAVEKELVTNGAPKYKIFPTGQGASKPIDLGSGEPSWAKNRRVEIRFFGVSDPKELQSELAALESNTLNKTQQAATKIETYDALETTQSNGLSSPDMPTAGDQAF